MIINVQDIKLIEPTLELEPEFLAMAEGFKAVAYVGSKVPLMRKAVVNG